MILLTPQINPEQYAYVTPGPRYDPARGRVSRESESSRGESRSLVGRPQEVAGVAGWCTPQTPCSVRPRCTAQYPWTQLQYFSIPNFQTCLTLRHECSITFNQVLICFSVYHAQTRSPDIWMRHSSTCQVELT